MADKISFVVSKMDIFLKELRVGIEKLYYVKKESYKQGDFLHKSIYSQSCDAIENNIRIVTKSAVDILNAMEKMSINLNSAKTELIKADSDSPFNKNYGARLYRGESADNITKDMMNSFEAQPLATILFYHLYYGSNAKSQFYKAQKEKDRELNRFEKEVKAFDIDGLSTDIFGYDTDILFNGDAAAGGKVVDEVSKVGISAAAGLFKAGFKVTSKGIETGGKAVEYIGDELTEFKNALSKFNLCGPELSLVGIGALREIEEVAQNVKNEGSILKTAFESLKNKLCKLAEIAHDGEGNPNVVIKFNKMGNKLTDYTNEAGNKIRYVEQRPSTIIDSIKAKYIKPKNVGEGIEAKVAKFINEKTSLKVTAFGQKVENMTKAKAAGDIDVATDKCIIEVKKSTKAIHMDQIYKYADRDNPNYLNYNGKKVILYIDEKIDIHNKYTVEKINEIKEKGITVVNNLDELKGELK
ncbi:hypothetical protein [Clostridium felsineum]|nr:hypothetical protein [Clostridium felsineum]